MKRLSMIVAIAALCVLGVIPVRAAKLDIYADINHSVCQLSDNVQPPVVIVYYFLSDVTEASAVQFTATKPSCWIGATFAGDNSPFVTIGNSQTSWAIAFGSCLHGTIYVGNTVYVVNGQGASCCQTTVGPGVWPFVYTTCDFGEHPVSKGQMLTINPDSSCQCFKPLATQPTTWGRVKSLYR